MARMVSVVEAPPRKKVRPFEVVVSRVIQETPDTVTLVFSGGDEHRDYKAGQFLTIGVHQFGALAGFAAYLEHLKKKKEQPRAYSLASAPYEPFIAITIKQERYLPGETPYPPLLSPLLVYQTPVGTRMTVTGFTGAYTLPDDVEQQTDHIVHIVAGSGSVPNYSILKQDLRMGKKLRHTFLYSNRTWDDVTFREPLGELEKSHPGRLRVVHTLTRETNSARFGERIRQGRIGPELIKEFVQDPKAAQFLVCGPAIKAFERKQALEKGVQPHPRFLESMLEHLHQLGVDTKKVKRESWG
jgi:3-ketosteroid 9alpha-monooxygenase subunit B